MLYKMKREIAFPNLHVCILCYITGKNRMSNIKTGTVEERKSVKYWLKYS